jgi:hypothetical protein
MAHLNLLLHSREEGGERVTSEVREEYNLPFFQNQLLVLEKSLPSENVSVHEDFISLIKTFTDIVQSGTLDEANDYLPLLENYSSLEIDVSEVLYYMIYHVKTYINTLRETS